MWQPNRTQWSILWTVAVLLILAWPPDRGRSLGVKAANWAADPAGALPTLPAPLPMALDDDGDAVPAHDALETELPASRRFLVRWRMMVKEASDPPKRSTASVAGGIAVLSALGVCGSTAKNEVTHGMTHSHVACRPPGLAQAAA